MPLRSDIKKVLMIGSGPIVIGPVSYTHLYKQNEKECVSL